MSEATLLNRLKKFGYGRHHGPMAKACAEAHAEIDRLRGLVEGLRNVRLNPTDADMPAARALYAELSNYQQSGTDTKVTD